MRALVLLTLLIVVAMARSGDPALSGPEQPDDPAVPRHLSVAPGEVIPAERGIWFVDPRTGAADGWEIGGGAAFVHWLASPLGRLIAYSIMPAVADRPPLWRLYDTRTGALRDLPGRPTFAPDESRYAIADAGGVSVFRADDGALDVRFGADPPAESPPYLPPPHWSPNATSLLGWAGNPFSSSAMPPPLLRMDLAVGAATPVTEALVRSPHWSPDGATIYFSSANEDRLTAVDAADQRPRWSLWLAELPGSTVRRDEEKPSGQIDLVAATRDGGRLALFARTYAMPPTAPFAVFSTAHVLDAATGAMQFRVEGASRCAPQVWSADGRWLLVVGRRGDRFGSYLVAADGSEIRDLGGHVQGISPADPAIGATHAYPDPGALRIVALPSGETLRTIDFAGPVMWHFEDQQWLADGRLVVVAPTAGRGGCLAGPGDERELEVRFP